MMTRGVKFVIVIALQILVIFAIIIFKTAVLSGGTEIILRIEPVDPRSPLRGDYVTFQYEISNIESYLLEDETEIKNNDSVYVALNRYGTFWTVDYVGADKPKDGIFIKGVVDSGAEDFEDEIILDPFELDSRFGDQRLHVIYGIEEYFIPEGEGRGFNFWDEEASALVIVDEDGNAVLKQIFIDGEPWP